MTLNDILVLSSTIINSLLCVVFSIFKKVIHLNFAFSESSMWNHFISLLSLTNALKHLVALAFAVYIYSIQTEFKKHDTSFQVVEVPITERSHILSPTCHYNAIVHPSYAKSVCSLWVFEWLFSHPLETLGPKDPVWKLREGMWKYTNLSLLQVQPSG